MLFPVFEPKTRKKLIILPGCKDQDFWIFQYDLTQTYNQKPAKQRAPEKLLRVWN